MRFLTYVAVVSAALWYLNISDAKGVLSQNENANTNESKEITDYSITNKLSFNSNFLIPSYEVEIVQSFNPKNTSKYQTKYFQKNSLTREFFLITVTAYTASADECGKSDGITASGTKVHKGTLACPKRFGFGTKIKIGDLGTYVCEDRGGSITGNHFDIYMPTKKEAISFGKQILLAQIQE